MKTISEDLFKLIEALSMTEKRYFKVYVSGQMKSKRKDYVLLFNAICLQKKYDEEAIKKQFKGKSFVKQLPAIKNYLYKIILKSLRNYYSENSVDQKLNNILNEVGVLFEKGIDEKCSHYLKKAKKIAYQFDKYNHLIHIIHWELKLVQAKQEVQQMEVVVGSLLNEEQGIYEILKNINELTRFKNEMYVLIRKYGVPRSNDVADAYTKIIQHPLLVSKKALSPQAMVIYNDVFSTYYFFVHKNYEKALSYQHKKVELFENMNVESDTIYSHLNSMHNIVMAYELSGNMSEAANQTKLMEEKLSQWRTKISERTFLKWQHLINRLKSEQLTETGNFKEALDVLNNVDDNLFKQLVKPNGINTNDIIVFYYAKSCLYFTLGQFSESLRCINAFLNRNDLSTNSAIFQFMNLFSLIVHFELGNTEFIANRIRAHYYFLKKKHHLYLYERMLLNLFKVLLKDSGEKKAIAPFVKMKNEMELIRRDSFEDVLLNYFDIISWLDSKIENRAFADVLRGKLRGRKNC